MTWHEKLVRKVKARVPLSLMDVPSFLLRRYVGYERRSGESARAALLRVAHRLADDPEWYEARMKMRNPAVSQRQQRFMCAEYGRLKRGRRSRSGIKKQAAKEFCMARRSRNPRKVKIEPMLSTADLKALQPYIRGLKKARPGYFDSGDVRFTYRGSTVIVPAKKEQRKKNPHLRSGKWQFVGMFEKRDVGSVKRILKIHGIKTKVTKDHVKGEKGMRELYVERAAWRTAYEAVTRLYEVGRAA